MIATVSFAKESFAKFNELCFGGGLPEVPIVLSRARSFLGRMEYRAARGLFGGIRGYQDFRMRISASFDLPAEEIEDVVLHEMIHYYIAFHNIKDTSAHGKVFRQMMNDINQRFGRNISIRHIVRSAPLSGDVQGRSAESQVDSEDIAEGAAPSERKRPKERYLCVTTLKDGQCGITVCASTRIFELYRKLPRYYKLSAMEWWLSADPYFSRYPRSNTPKIYRITRAELDVHLVSAIRLVCDGRSIKPVGSK